MGLSISLYIYFLTQDHRHWYELVSMTIPPIVRCTKRTPSSHELLAKRQLLAKDSFPGCTPYISFWYVFRFINLCSWPRVPRSACGRPISIWSDPCQKFRRSEYLHWISSLLMLFYGVMVLFLKIRVMPLDRLCKSTGSPLDLHWTPWYNRW